MVAPQSSPHAAMATKPGWLPGGACASTSLLTWIGLFALLGAAYLWLIIRAVQWMPPSATTVDWGEPSTLVKKAKRITDKPIRLGAAFTSNEVGHEKGSISFLDDTHGQSPECVRDASPVLFSEWKQGRESVCDESEVSVTNYVLRRWESEPTFRVYENIVLRTLHTPSSGGELTPFSCGELERSTDGGDRSGETSNVVDRPVIRINLFDSLNSYERFHSYLNVAMAMFAFNVTNPLIVLVPSDDIFKWMGGEIPPSDLEMYSSLSSAEPIVLTEKSVKSTKFTVPLMIDVSNTGTSIMVAKSGEAFWGRGVDHHCKSTVFQGIIRWMRRNLIGDPPFNDEGDGIIRVAWSSRAPYCCRPSRGRTYVPARHIWKELELVRNVGQELSGEACAAAVGSLHKCGRYEITIVNFGSLSARESVTIASQSRLMVGVHGAGLVWSAFMRPHSGVVEIFGGDRDSSNRHYHNIASLADLDYRSLILEGSSASLSWDRETVELIARKVQSIDFDAEPRVEEP